MGTGQLLVDRAIPIFVPPTSRKLKAVVARDICRAKDWLGAACIISSEHTAVDWPDRQSQSVFCTDAPPGKAL